MTLRICTVGDNVVDRYVDDGIMYPGGNAVNVAVHAARSGANTEYIGAVGNDEPGTLVLDSLAAEGVSTTRCRILDGQTAYALVKVAGGERNFVGADVGVSRVVLTDEDFDYLRRFDLIHTGDCSGTEGQLGALAECAPVSFDFSDRPLSYAEPLLPHVAIATFSGSRSDDRTIQSLINWAHSLGPKTVIVTRGSKGAVLSDRSTRIDYPARPVNTVDTLGAGDAYIGAVLASLLRGESLETAARHAADNAAIICTQLGAYGYSTPDTSQIAVDNS